MTILSLLLAFAANTVDVVIVSVPLENTVKVALTPAGKAEIRHESTLSHVKLEVERLQPASSFGPVFNTYVVWAASPEGILENLGELDTNGNKGRFYATTRLEQLGIFITAEPHYMVDRPSSAVAFKNQSARDEVRRISVPIEVGTYDYSKIQPTGAAANEHGSVIQARVAFKIAENANAERLAETEFRQARIAVGSMEELVNRSSPLDILWPAANQAIRWSQVAFTAARTRR